MIQDLRGEEVLTPTTGVVDTEADQITHGDYEIHEINEASPTEGAWASQPASDPTAVPPKILSLDLFDLPFPTGYDGLPRAQVEMALAWLDKVGVTDPALLRYNVMSWVRSYLQWHGQNRGELYEGIKSEQLRLGRIIDPGGDPAQDPTIGEGMPF